MAEVSRKLPTKSRREKRKEARTAKKQTKHQSWIERQEAQKSKKTSIASKSVNKEKEENHKEASDSDDRNEILAHSSIQENPEVKNEILLRHGSTALKHGKAKRPVKKSRKTKFEEYLEKDMRIASVTAEDDLKLERKLAKKLKVKEGKLRGFDDGLNIFYKGVPSILDSFNQEEVAAEEDLKGEEKKSSRKKRRRKDSIEHVSDGVQTVDFEEGTLEPEEPPHKDVQLEDIPSEEIPKKKQKKNDRLKVDLASEIVESSGAEIAMREVPPKASVPEVNVKKYVAPHLRARAGSEPEEHTQLRRRIRGLLNRLSESNVESVTEEVATVYQTVVRSIGSQIVSEEVLASCSGGPRGNEQYAAIFAAFVAGLACKVGVDFSAKLLASLAKNFEDEYLKEDNLSLRNITLLLSYLCIFGVCSSDLIYDFLIILSKRLAEIDVSTILTILQCCGMKIRGDDPVAMKNFIVSVQNKVNELKASPVDGQSTISGKRMEFMLETICDIKNNKKKTKEDSIPHTRIKKWLQKLRAEDILIRGIKWSKLLDPNKKGQWWLSGDLTSPIDNIEEVASTIDKEVLEAQKMLQLASSQRMNTDARRAIFCIIMTGDDYIDTFEKLLRLDLPGKQDREIVRVLVECCLQEKVFNKYYVVLATKLCEHDKNHKFTLQYCLWDQFKEVESMQLQRCMHLAKFVAEMVTSFTLSLAVLKAVDFSDVKQMTPKRIMHFRMMFETMLENASSKTVWNVFTRVAVVPELELLRHGILFFIREYVVKKNKGFADKFEIVKKALNNAQGVLM